MLRPSKIVCVGRNYVAHARELGNEVPAEPLLFFKPPSSLIADGDAIVLPPLSRQVEFEGEIGVIVGTRLRGVDEADARAAISHVVPANDVTARDLQRTDGQWARAKGFDTFCPVGVPAPVAGLALDRLELRTSVNGVERQRGRADEMAFDLGRILAHIAGIMTLEPGDLVLTGTPAGVGPLAPGDRVRVEIVGVGAVENPVVAG